MSWAEMAHLLHVRHLSVSHGWWWSFDYDDDGADTTYNGHGTSSRARTTRPNSSAQRLNSSTASQQTTGLVRPATKPISCSGGRRPLRPASRFSLECLFLAPRTPGRRVRVAVVVLPQTHAHGGADFEVSSSSDVQLCNGCCGRVGACEVSTCNKSPSSPFPF